MTPNMDIIFIKQLKLDTIIGIHDWEREKQQPIILDIEIGYSIKSAVQSDQIENCIDYSRVCERLKQLAQNHQYQLVESFAEASSHIILQEFMAHWVRIKLSKPNAINEASGVGIIIERERHKTKE